MATTYNNAQIGVVDASGNLNVIYPITKATNVAYKSTNVDAKLTSLQSAVDTLNSNKAFSSSKIFRLNEDKSDSKSGGVNVSSSIGAQNTKLIVFGSYYATFTASGGNGATQLRYTDTNDNITLIDGLYGTGTIGYPPKTVNYGYASYTFDTGYISLVINTSIKEFSLSLSGGGASVSGRVYTNFYFIPTM